MNQSSKNVIKKINVLLILLFAWCHASVSAEEPSQIPKSPAVSSQTSIQTNSQPNAQTNSQTNAQMTPETSAQMTPDAALQRLLDGNKRFMEDKSICPDRTQDRRAATVAKQKPFAIILGCSDSRVPPELAFDQGIGDLFVVRVAGNVVGGLALDSIEYSVLFNNSVIVLVLGHKNCGAVDAVLNDSLKKLGIKDLSVIVSKIEPVIRNLRKVHPNPTLDEAIVANIRNSMAQVKSSSVISKYISEGKLKVVGAYYDLATGEARVLKD